LLQTLAASGKDGRQRDQNGSGEGISQRDAGG
jgi:hypothetical protein